MPITKNPPKAVRASARKPRVVIGNSELSSTAPFDDDNKWNLYITTKSKICAWNREGCDSIFTSSSKGIVAAKQAHDGSILAIADAQVVMLHDIKYGQSNNRSYRLRGTQRCRLLQYSHDCRSLFFTDSLHNNVQSYSLSNNKVVAAAKSHPSPITAFSISCDSNLILSASADPPTTQIHNQLLGTTLLLAPASSSASVVTCTFHPSRKHLFVMAFGDGVLAAYDYNRLSKKDASGPGPTRVHVRAIHAFRHLHDPSIAGSAGITGVGFVPGQRSRAVTVGEDGRCFLIDFDKGDTLGSWHIGAPATGLSIREIVSKTTGKKPELGGHLIAVGTVHGKCVVFDGNGNRIAERAIHTDGESVLAVEWVHGDVNIPQVDEPALPDSPLIPKSSKKSKRSRPRAVPDRAGITPKAEPSSEQQHSPVASPHSTVGSEHTGEVPQEVSTKRRNRTVTPASYDPLQITADEGYMQLFSPVTKKRVPKPASLPEKEIIVSHKTRDPRLRNKERGIEARSAISAPLLWQENANDGNGTIDQLNNVQEGKDGDFVNGGAFDAFQTETLKETITPEETAPSNAQTIINVMAAVPGNQVKVEETTDDGRVLSEIRSVRGNFTCKAKGSTGNLALFAPYMPSRIRSTPGSKVGGGTAMDSTTRKAISEPGKGTITESADVSCINTTTSDDIDGAIVREGHTEADNKNEKNVLNPISEEKPLDEPEDDLGDIWLAQTSSSYSARIRKRKRKKVVADDEGNSSVINMTTTISPGNDIDLSHSSSLRSSKSRKTVTWPEDSQGLLQNQDSIPKYVHLNSISLQTSSVAARNGDFSGSSIVTESLIPMSSPPHPLSTSSQNNHINTAITTAPDTSSSTHGTNWTPAHSKSNMKAVNPSFVNTSRFDSSASTPRSLDEVLKSALAEMQLAMSQEIRAMQEEMQRQFRQQNRELQGLKNEMGRVIDENEKLRNMLFKNTGVRDTIRSMKTVESASVSRSG